MIMVMKEMERSQIGLNFQGEVLQCLNQDHEELAREEAQPEAYRGLSHQTVAKLIKKRIWILIN